ncbi:hypothetical protein [Pseudomonas phage UF_RH7]|nr:hypothetical protein [Pseudomonas phage UF_RH7]
MMLIYIAGPYRHVEGGKTVEQNILAARRTGLQVIQLQLNMFPVVPHMSTAHMELDVPEVSDEYFLKGTLEMMRKCDAVLLTEPHAYDKSVGTRNEMYHAHYCGIPVFPHLENLVAWYHMQQNGDTNDEEPTPPAAPV